MKWLKERATERSTYIGLAQTLLGIGIVAKVDEAPQIAESVTQAAEPLASGNYQLGLGVLLMGILSVFVGEKRK